MKDVLYGFKLAIGFLVAQLILSIVGIGIGFGILYGLGMTLASVAGN